MSTRPLFSWLGGKFKQASMLCQQLPDHTCFVEVFGGAGNLLMRKDPSKTEVYNDISGDLTNLFRIVKFHPREFVRNLAFQTHNRSDYDAFKANPGITDIQRALAFYCCLKMAFGGKVASQAFGYGRTGTARLNRRNIATIRACHRRLSGVFIENLDFADLIARYDSPATVFYCDPPYLCPHGKYDTPFAEPEHQRLAETLKNIQGKFLLSCNDHPLIRKLYKVRGIYLQELSIRYTISNEQSKRADFPELLISNYKLPKAK